MTCATVAGLTSWCGRRQRISTGGRWSRRVPARIRVLSYWRRREDRGLPLDPNRASSYCWRHGSCGGRNIARHCRHLLPRPNHWRHRRPRADTAGHGEIPAALPDTSVANRIGRKGVCHAAITAAMAPPAESPATYTRAASTWWSAMIWRVMPAMMAGSPAPVCWWAGENQFQ